MALFYFTFKCKLYGLQSCCHYVHHNLRHFAVSAQHAVSAEYNNVTHCNVSCATLRKQWPAWQRMLECFTVEVTAVSKAVFWDVTQGSGKSLPRSHLRISRRKPAITLFLLSHLSVCARKQNQTAPPLVTFSNSNVTVSILWTGPTLGQSFDPRAFLEVQLAFRSGCGNHRILPYR
jgi:hypothetical protein